MTRKIIGVFALKSAAIMLAVLAMACASVAQAADAPKWSGGFPKLVEKNALLQWDLVKGASDYKVYRSESKDKDFKLVATVKPNRHIDKEVPAGKTLYYSVSAVVDGKEGPRSEARSITAAKEKAFVPLKKPELAGAHAKTGAGGKPSIGLRWEGGAGSDLVGYNVYRSTKKGADYVLIGSTATDTYNDEDVKAGNTYYYVVTAVDSGFNETKYSNELSASIVKQEATAKKEKEEVPPTKMRAAKLLFTIPRDPADKDDKIPVPENAQDVVVDEAVGHIYVTSYGYGGVLVYDMNGRFQFGIRKDGVSGDEKIGAAENIALGPNGNIYVTDYTSPDLLVFDYQGKPIDKITVDISHVPGREKLKATLYGVELDKDGTVYVTDPRSNRIYGYNQRKERVFELAQNKKKEIDFTGPSFMMINKDGDLTFVDSNHSTLQVVGTDGKFRRTIGKKGMGAGFLFYPVGLANGNKGEMFSASGRSPNIQAFGTDGKFLYLLGNEKLDGPPPVADMRGIYVDSQDRVYVADGLANRVVVLQMLDKYVDVVPEK